MDAVTIEISIVSCIAIITLFCPTMQEEFVRKSRQILAGLCVTPPLRIFWRFTETMHLRARYADQISKADLGSLA